jgi:hypothetical protein
MAEYLDRIDDLWTTESPLHEVGLYKLTPVGLRA